MNLYMALAGNNVKTQSVTILAILVYSALTITMYEHALKDATALPRIDSSLTTADLIIFSFDRPTQLYALLESLNLNIRGIESTTVIYRSSHDRFTQAYAKVAQQFPAVRFVQQGKQPAHDFKPLVLEAFRMGKSPYICFAVDDIIVKAKADMNAVTAAMAATGAYGFYLRLGQHLTQCYSEGKAQPVPPLSTVENSMLSWTLKDGIHDWGFANTVDMTIYRKKDLIKNFVTMDYANPNKLEGIWARYAHGHHNKKGLCFSDSVIVNIPINLVQDVCHNRHMNAWSTDQLLEKFNEGLKIDIRPLQGIKNESCHIDYSLTFTNR